MNQKSRIAHRSETISVGDKFLCLVLAVLSDGHSIESIYGKWKFFGAGKDVSTRLDASHLRYGNCCTFPSIKSHELQAMR